MARPKKIDIDKLREQTKAKTEEKTVTKPVPFRSILTIVDNK